MRRRLVVPWLLAPLLAACGGVGAATVHTTVLTTDTAGQSVTCHGWYVVSGGTLRAHLFFTGPVRGATVSAVLYDGTRLGPTRTVAVSPGASRGIVQLGGVTTSVTTATASVAGAVPLARNSCLLANPH